MKNNLSLKSALFLSFLGILLISNNIGYSQEATNQFKGVILDSQTKKPLVFASISTNKTNISTVSNSQGKFTIKIPENDISAFLVISSLGYKNRTVSILELKEEENEFLLFPDSIKLDQIVVERKNAEKLMREVLLRKGDNYSDKNMLMNAFYRESIKKRRRYVSLSEAIININKAPYNSLKNEQIKLFKARKSTDYKRLDTLAFKLQGGPFNTLKIDVIKYPSSTLLSKEMFNLYDFTFQGQTKKDGNLMYIIGFKQKPHIEDPLYHGVFYVDSNSLALSSAVFKLNLENKEKVSSRFVVRKPLGVKSTPLDTNYRIDYRIKNNKWYFGYSRIDLSFKINWKKKIFNSIYNATLEMAATGFEENTTKFKKGLRQSVIMSDDVTGFSDPDFWGSYNIIEPDKPIEEAISKIKKNLDKIQKQS